MKKLMIVAAAAAMTGVVSAAECVTAKCAEDPTGATAYTLTLSLKTTAPKQKISGDECCEECTYWNVQKTKKFSGIIYGSAECAGCTMLGEDLAMLLWDATNKQQADADLNLWVGRYEKTGTKVEAYGTIAGDDFGTIGVAGFGSLYLKTTKAACEDPECYAFVKNIAGNAAGFLVRADVGDCTPVEYTCDCGEPLENAAASGSWKVSYNATVAKKLAKQGVESTDELNIAAAYKVPAYVDVEETNEVTIEE